MWLVKNVKFVRLFWIIQVDTKYNHQYLYMKEAEEVCYRREGSATMALRVEEGIMGQEIQEMNL